MVSRGQFSSNTTRLAVKTRSLPKLISLALGTYFRDHRDRGREKERDRNIRLVSPQNKIETKAEEILAKYILAEKRTLYRPRIRAASFNTRRAEAEGANGGSKLRFRGSDCTSPKNSRIARGRGERAAEIWKLREAWSVDVLCDKNRRNEIDAETVDYQLRERTIAQVLSSLRFSEHFRE